MLYVVCNYTNAIVDPSCVMESKTTDCSIILAQHDHRFLLGSHHPWAPCLYLYPPPFNHLIVSNLASWYATIFHYLRLCDLRLFSITYASHGLVYISRSATVFHYLRLPWTGVYFPMMSSRVARRCSAQHQIKLEMWDGVEVEGKRNCNIASLWVAWYEFRGVDKIFQVNKTRGEREIMNRDERCQRGRLHWGAEYEGETTRRTQWNAVQKKY